MWCAHACREKKKLYSVYYKKKPSINGKKTQGHATAEMFDGTSTSSMGSMPSDVDFYVPFSGYSRKQKGGSCVTCSTTKEGLVRDEKVAPALVTPESGGYVPFDVMSTGASGAADYDRAMRESQMARENPTLLAMNTSKDLDVSWHEPIVPRKPKPVQLAGMSVFGTGGPTSTSRGMTTDFRGEAVDRYAVGPPPEGAAISGRMGTMPNVKEYLNSRGAPSELHRCYANPKCGANRQQGTYKPYKYLNDGNINGFAAGFLAF